MSQIKPSYLIITITLALALSGCGTKNDKAAEFNPDSKHPSDWMAKHAEAELESCTECHGENYDGGISKVSCTSTTAVSGFKCHASSPVANPSGCTSCHGGRLSAPFGSAQPNRQFAHMKHIALAGVTCETCHSNAGSKTALHAKAKPDGGYNNATVNLSPSFNIDSTSGAFSYNNGTCSNVSCHGGKVTPPWTDTTTLLVAGDDTKCKSCHESGIEKGKPQFNSFYSGNLPGSNEHITHLNRGIKCTDCHNIGKLTNYNTHFNGITTKSIISSKITVGNEGVTNSNGVTFPTKILTYSGDDQTCSFNSTSGCHSGLTKHWGLE